MIPYKLRLENFLSYREGLEPLDFAGMHLVCLTGQNGHGKSALLDAITWALWGKGRALSDDDMMHTGSSEMQVEYEFGLSGLRYNVVRKRLARGRTKKSELEIGVWEEGIGAWQPLTEPTLRATQARINDVLRMDYETFVNSAFLKQGEADAFTSKSPGQRKDILATILNLSQYDAYAERAKTLAKQSEGEAFVLEQRVNEIDAELAQRPQHEEDLRSATLAETQATLRRDAAKSAADAARLALQDLTNKQAARQDLAKRLERALRDHAETGQQLQVTQKRLVGVEALLAERQVIEQGHADLEAARAEEQAWSERLHARRPLEQEFQGLQRVWLEAKGEIEREQAVVQRQLAEVEKRAAAVAELTATAEGVKVEIARLAEHQARSQENRDRLAALGAERQRLDAERTRIEAEGMKLRERLDVLRAGESVDCPVCKQPLSAKGRQNLEQEYEQQLAGLRQQVKVCNEGLKQAAADQKALRAALNEDEKALRQLERLQRQLAEAETTLVQAQAAAEARPALLAQAESLALKLADEDFAPDVRAKMAEIEAEMAAQAYDERAHRQARATISDLGGIERKFIELEEALKQEPGLRQQVRRLQERWQREEEQSAADRARLQQLEAEVAGLPQAQANLRQQNQVGEQARIAWEQARDRVVAGQQRLSALDVLVESRRQRLGELTAVRERARRYRHLQEAFGPKGVQAMIIEAALPELETEANRLLGRLSDGRMSVRLDTQRDLKSGGTRETLDIIISDELGSRPYELYSGGEAFRADLALRIALSRLLARRAGAALQTLFIDEGFGTQDAHGRENLVDALHMIKDEFALVLVITHLEELKEQFPVRIQVIKEEGRGSRYVVE